ncbi:MAG: hypothetical protein RIQ41_45 [Candidatus Parcubacteria bacterium]
MPKRVSRDQQAGVRYDRLPKYPEKCKTWEEFVEFMAKKPQLAPFAFRVMEQPYTHGIPTSFSFGSDSVLLDPIFFGLCRRGEGSTLGSHCMFMNDRRETFFLDSISHDITGLGPDLFSWDGSGKHGKISALYLSPDQVMGQLHGWMKYQLSGDEVMSSERAREQLKAKYWLKVFLAVFLHVPSEVQALVTELEGKLAKYREQKTKELDVVRQQIVALEEEIRIFSQ